jgi:hypothetical protein
MSLLTAPDTPGRRFYKPAGPPDLGARARPEAHFALFYFAIRSHHSRMMLTPPRLGLRKLPILFFSVAYPRLAFSSALRFFLLALLLLGNTPGWAAEKVLFDFEPPLDAAKFPVSDSKTTLVPSSLGRALRVQTGHRENWPGVTLPAPDGKWDLLAFDEVTMSVTNAGRSKLTVFCRVDNAGADGTKHCLTESIALEPGKAGRLSVRLIREGSDKLGGKLFGMRGYPVAAGVDGTIDPSRVNQLLVFVSNPKEDHVFEIDDVRAEGSYVQPTASTRDADPFFPFIDTFGQYKHRNWPGKTRSVKDMQERREREKSELAQNSGPQGWNKYGGWADGPKLKATGFFRTQKHEGKWWLVDPDGRLFFSQGIDCVRMRDSTPIAERESWFEDFPGKDPAFSGFLGSGFALHGYYAGKTPSSFSFAGANIVRKYGASHQQVYPEIIQRRLRSWGINTIGMWSDEATRLLRRTPYVDAASSHGTRMIEGSQGYWGKFPDVFDPSFSNAVRRSVEGKSSAKDPWCIGYFSDNEMSWGDETSLSLAALKSPASQALKQAFVADLKTKYMEIGKLNEAWGMRHDSWETMLASTNAPDPKAARQDLESFYTRAAEQYFRTVRAAIKAVAPDQLYLGCRFAWVNARAAAAAAKYCDVVSYNLYQRSVADFQFNGGADVPLIIGEFHFGALDRGMFHTGLVPVKDQAARANAYVDYVLGARRHPALVGCHWFQYQDEPTTGRVYDEENYQIGFVDIADTPYAEMIQASRAVAAKLYGR